MILEKGLLYLKSPGPRQLTYDGHMFYRYMDQIYIPKIPSKLDINDVITLSNIRMKLAGDIIDTPYNLRVMGALYSILENRHKTERIIDFGCGSGLIHVLFPKGTKRKIPLEILGLDINPEAVKTAMINYEKSEVPHYRTELFNEKTNLNIQDEYFDGIFSSFVMHFTIYDHQLLELYRLLKYQGFFVWNDYLYDTYKGHSERLVKRMTKIGFSVSKERISFKLSESNEIRNHMFFFAEKTKTSDTP